MDPVLFYSIAKDFAAPIATVTAALTVVGVTFFIQRQNYHLAQERVRLDLFDKRYEVYVATRELLVLLLNVPDQTDLSVKQAISNHYMKINEAPFTCSKEVQAFCDAVIKGHQAWAVAKFATDNMQMFDPDDRAFRANDWVEQTKNIMRLAEQVTPVFGGDLRLKRLY